MGKKGADRSNAVDAIDCNTRSRRAGISAIRSGQVVIPYLVPEGYQFRAILPDSEGHERIIALSLICGRYISRYLQLFA